MMKKILLVLIVLMTTHFAKAVIIDENKFTFSNNTGTLPTFDMTNSGDAVAGVKTNHGLFLAMTYKNAAKSPTGELSLILHANNFAESDVPGSAEFSVPKGVGRILVTGKGQAVDIYIDNVKHTLAYGEYLEINKAGVVTIKLVNNSDDAFAYSTVTDVQWSDYEEPVPVVGDADKLVFTDNVFTLNKYNQGNSSTETNTMTSEQGKNIDVSFVNAAYDSEDPKLLYITSANYASNMGVNGFVEFTLPNGVKELKVDVDNAAWDLFDLYIDDVKQNYTVDETIDISKTGKVKVKIMNFQEDAVSTLLGVEWTNYITTDVADNTTEGIQCYPNPLQDVLNFNGSDAVQRVSIYNTSGSLVKTVANVQNNRVNCIDLQKGIYVVKVTTVSNDTYTRKIIKE